MTPNHRAAHPKPALLTPRSAFPHRLQPDRHTELRGLPRPADTGLLAAEQPTLRAAELQRLQPAGRRGGLQPEQLQLLLRTGAEQLQHAVDAAHLWQQRRVRRWAELTAILWADLLLPQLQPAALRQLLRWKLWGQLPELQLRAAAQLRLQPAVLIQQPAALLQPAVLIQRAAELQPAEPVQQQRLLQQLWAGAGPAEQLGRIPGAELWRAAGAQPRARRVRPGRLRARWPW